MENKHIKKVNFSLGELIDKLSILQIKELKKGENFFKEMDDIGHDIEAISKEHQIKLTPNLIRQISQMAQANLWIWNLKDRMVNETEEYKSEIRLSMAQIFNNCIKNSIKNMLLAKTNEDKEPKLRATFADPTQWYSAIIDSMGMKNET